MRRLFLYSPTFLLTLAIGLGVVSVEVTEQKLPTKGSEVPPQHYDFFSRPELGVTQSDQPFRALDARKTFCSDPKLRPIWNAIRRDEESREFLDYTTESPDCRNMFEIKYVDLNRDGRKEVLVRSTIAQFCGAVGNCDFWILEKTRKGHRILLHGDDYVDITRMGGQILRTRTHGYSDILLKGHFSVSETSYSTYRFNGRRYVETKCLYEIPKARIGDNTAWQYVTCKEFDRRLNF